MPGPSRVSKRKIKKQLPGLLAADLQTALTEIKKFPLQPVVSGLISCLFRTEERVKWHAVTALGQVMNELAGRDIEAARGIMRRLLWSMNEESGGIGWGIPEAMGEIMAVNPRLAREYVNMLVSYMREENYLELPALQRCLLWGVARLAMARPELLLSYDADGYLADYLESRDRIVVGLAARAFGFLRVRDAVPHLRLLVDEPLPFRIYENEQFLDTTVGRVARRALEMIGK